MSIELIVHGALWQEKALRKYVNISRYTKCRKRL